MKVLCVVFITILLLLGVTGTVSAQGGYDLSWWTINGGGDTSTGGNYSLSGTLGQPEVEVLSGGSYTLYGGFWGGIAEGLPPGLCGDANVDTVVNTLDAVQVLRRAVNLASFTPQQEKNADTNKDNAINVLDAIKILRIAVQLDLPCTL